MNQEAACDLSVIIPTYNYGEFIGSAVLSVLGQIPDGREVEIVVADDGSTDGTEDVLRPLVDGHAVRYFRQDNQGPSSARNLGLSNARGRNLMLLDADDSLRPGCVEVTLDFMDQNPEVGVFFTNYDIYDDEGVIRESGVDTWEHFRSIPHRVVGDGAWVFSESLTPWIIRDGAFMHTSGFTLRREVFEAIGPFREGYSYGEDDEFYARAAWVAAAGYVDRVLSRKRNHPESLIHKPANSLRNAEHLVELTEIQLEYYADVPELRAILRRKLRRIAAGWCWRLIEAGQRKRARQALGRYRARFPGYWGFYWLTLRSWLPPRPG